MYLHLYYLLEDSCRRKKIENAFLEMIMLDLQPAKIVEDIGFRKFVATLDARYQLPSRRTIMRNLMPVKYQDCAESLIHLLEDIESCSLTTDFWTSRANESFITVTCHFINKEWVLKSHILSTYQVTGSHNAVKIASELEHVADKWKITDKISCIVTDNAANMVAALRATQWKHIPCMAHTLNLIVQESLNKDRVLVNLRAKCRHIVTFFRHSTQAYDKLKIMQKENNKEEKKLVQEVETRWNSTFYMFQRIVEEYKEVKLTLCSLDREDLSISIDDVKIISEAIEVLQPFEEATRELSSEYYVSISKVIPLARSLQRLTSQSNLTLDLKHELLSSMSRRFTNMEANYTLTVSTLLDPRFKRLGFNDSSKYQSAMEKLGREMAATNTESSSGEQSSSACSTSGLWSFVDTRFAELGHAQPTEHATIIKSYLDQGNIPRKEDPLKKWNNDECVYVKLVPFVKKYLSIPATSVPSERLFSKAGELISHRRNRLKSKNIDMMLFLNSFLQQS